MQLLLPLNDEPLALATVHACLLARFGRPGPWRHLRPLDQLVIGMVGGRTREAESRAAYEALRSRFATWEAVRDAPLGAVRDAVTPVNFAERKAPFLQAAMRAITARRRRLEIDFLGRLSVDAALSWLERLPGVGRKVSAATLNFSTLRMRALVVDTHHLRVARRLRWIGSRANHEDAYRRLMPRLPAAWGAAEMDDHHQLLKRLGQEFCHVEAPDCASCPLRDLCPSRRTDLSISTRHRRVPVAGVSPRFRLSSATKGGYSRSQWGRALVQRSVYL